MGVMDGGGLRPALFCWRSAAFGRQMSRSGMTVEERIAERIGPALEDMGFALVRVRLTSGQRLTLQVMADRLDGAPITVDECADISRAISAILDVEDPIDDAYRLEVSSPGIDRPLTRERDFERFAGHQVRIELQRLIDGRRRFRGTLGGIADGLVTVETDNGRVEIPFAEIRDSRLVLTDALIEETRANAAGRE